MRFRSCTAAQEADLTQAQGIATQYARDSRDALINIPVLDRYTAERFITWFGKYYLSRFNLAVDVYDKIYSALSSEVITYDCSCTLDDHYARVDSDNPYIIFICPLWSNMPMTGIRSKAGTVIHEMTHFDSIASTSDFAQLQDECKYLAANSPHVPVKNLTITHKSS